MTAKTVMKGCMPIWKPTAEGEVWMEDFQWACPKDQGWVKFVTLISKEVWMRNFRVTNF